MLNEMREIQGQLDLGTEHLREEADLIAIAKAVVDSEKRLFPNEVQVLKRAGIVPTDSKLAALQQAFLSGRDPLGDAFISIRSPDQRRKDGATYTPTEIVASMVEWSADKCSPMRVVDPGAGTGRFTLAAAARFPRATLVAVDVDPLATLLLRVNAKWAGIEDRLSIVLNDYRDLTLPEIQGTTLFIGNPPYVRHHGISPGWKSWFKGVGEEFGQKVSQLAGLHVHFFFKTAKLMNPGDTGAFITASEWLDVNYGSSLRRLFLEELGGVSLHTIRPTAMPFQDTATTGTIACFVHGEHLKDLRVEDVRTIDSLGALKGGTVLPRELARSTSRWTQLLHRRPARPSGHIQVGELFRAHRGQVTGANKVWIQGAYTGELPESFLFPTVTRARELIEAAPRLTDAGRLRLVLDLPPCLDDLDAETLGRIEAFLDWARSLGADDGYIARHRKSWWSIGLRDPAPILATYMARRAPTFVLNRAGARHINIAHGLYPREPMSDPELEAVVDWLNHSVSVDDGRTYAGGLTKFEPRELERLTMPSLQEIHDYSKNLDSRRAAARRRVSEAVLSGAPPT